MSRHTKTLGLATETLQHGAFRMASGEGWLALLGADKEYVPIEPWGRKRDKTETTRVNAEWDKITGDTFWNTAGELYQRYHAELDIWEMDDTGTFNAVNEFLRSLGCDIVQGYYLSKPLTVEACTRFLDAAARERALVVA